MNVSVPDQERRAFRFVAAALFALGLAVRVPVLLSDRAIFGGDSVLRLARSDELLIGYWLPLPQLLVFVARAIHPDPLWTRLAFAVVGALVPVALARAVAGVHGGGSGAQPQGAEAERFLGRERAIDSRASDSMDEKRAAEAPDRSGASPRGSGDGIHFRREPPEVLAGACAGALLALHPLWAYYSLVPYQEGLMALFLLLGAEALARGREGRAAVWLGLACWCRYEAWIAAGLAAACRWRRPSRAVLFLWAPLLWTAAHLGLSPRGSYVLDLDPAAGHWTRLAFLLSKVREYSGDALLLLAAAGIAVAWRRRDRRWGWGALFAAAVVFTAALAGHETPPGSGRISERMAHLPVAALCASAGLALATLVEVVPRRARVFGRVAAVTVLAVLGWLWHAQLRAQVREAASDPSVRLAVQVADLADRELPPGGRIAVAGAPLAADAVEAYVRKVASSGGDVAAARAIADRFALHSPDLDRIAAQLPRRPGTAIAAPAGPAALLAVFDDASLPPPCGAARARFRAGPRAVTVCASAP